MMEISNILIDLLELFYYMRLYLRDSSNGTQQASPVRISRLGFRIPANYSVPSLIALPSSKILGSSLKAFSSIATKSIGWRHELDYSIRTASAYPETRLLKAEATNSLSFQPTISNASNALLVKSRVFPPPINL